MRKETTSVSGMTQSSTGSAVAQRRKNLKEASVPPNIGLQMVGDNALAKGGDVFMRKTVLILGTMAGLSSIALWVVLVFYNPYTPSASDGLAATTLLMLVLPACLAIISSLIHKKYLMLMAFIWSLPLSLYLAFTPGIFAWFFASCIAYFVSFLLMVSVESR